MSEGLWLGFIFPLSTEQHFLNVSVVGKASQPFPLVDDGVIRAVKKEPMTLKGYKCCRFRTTGFYGNWSENRTLNGWITIIQSSQFGSICKLQENTACLSGSYLHNLFYGAFNETLPLQLLIFIEKRFFPKKERWGFSDGWYASIYRCYQNNLSSL